MSNDQESKRDFVKDLVAGVKATQEQLRKDGVLPDRPRPEVPTDIIRLVHEQVQNATPDGILKDARERRFNDIFKPPQTPVEQSSEDSPPQVHAGDFDSLMRALRWFLHTPHKRWARTHTIYWKNVTRAMLDYIDNDEVRKEVGL